MVGHDLPVADDQMDSDSHRYDDLQGNKVGGDHADFPIKQAQQPSRSKNRRAAGQQRQQDPTELAENKPRGEKEKLAGTVEEAPVKPKASKLESLLRDMRTNNQPETIMAIAPPETMVEDTPESPVDSSPAPLAGYIVFFGAILFFMRPQQTSD